MATTSHCEKDHGDKIFFISKEDEDKLVDEMPPPEELTPTGGAVGPDGEIDWDCPCLGPMTKPPCGDVFKTAFSCFVNSESEIKGSECIEQFKAMRECVGQHPEVYGLEGDQDGREESTTANESELEATSRDAESPTENDGAGSGSAPE